MNTEICNKNVEAIVCEHNKAISKHPPFSSRHEAYAIIKEEIEEMWEVIKKNGPTDRLREETIQVGAMILRFLNEMDSLRHG